MLDNHRPSPALAHCLLGEQVVAVTTGGRVFATWDGGELLSLRVLRPDGRIATIQTNRDDLLSTEQAVAAAHAHFNALK